MSINYRILLPFIREIFSLILTVNFYYIINNFDTALY
jgi:hypothetical protein